MRKLGLGTLRRIVLLIFFALFAAVTLRWISLERWRWTITRVEESSPTPTAAPSPTATRAPVLSGKFDVARLFNGITLRSEVETATGAELVTLEPPNAFGLAFVRFSPDGHFLAACGSREQVALWDLPNLRQELAALRLDWSER